MIKEQEYFKKTRGTTTFIWDGIIEHGFTLLPEATKNRQNTWNNGNRNYILVKHKSVLPKWQETNEVSLMIATSSWRKIVWEIICQFLKIFNVYLWSSHSKYLNKRNETICFRQTYIEYS